MGSIKWYLLLLAASIAPSSGTEWTPANYPNPYTQNGSKVCNRPAQSFVCDPDKVISTDSANVVEGIIKDIHNAVDPYSSDGCAQHSSDFPGFQVAVALMDKMQIVASPPEEAAQQFATQLFDSWGVGDAECGNGVVLLLSRLDRQVYIATGRQAASVATPQRLRAVIDGMRPLLREGDYNQALEQGVVDLGLVLGGADPGQGEGHGDLWGVGIFVAIFSSIVGFTGWKSWKQRRDQRKCVSLLEKLKREQRFAVSSGRYPAASCPICFEDFQEGATPSAPPLPLDGDTSTHNQGRSGQLDDTSAPLLNPLGKKDSNSKKESAPESSRGSERDLGKGSGKEGSEKKKRLSLPCGHTFCETCISSWLDSNVTCPICRKSMNGDDSGQAGPSRPRSDTLASQDREGQLALYNQEVEFRMMGLHRMYPWYVTRGMVTHAQDAAHRGHLFDFETVRQEQVAADVRARHMHSGGGGGGMGGFGGGSHSGGGGVGGSW